ncbi:MAG: MATE family efflux transporter [Oscillospiraceae bacterium]|nr:MATE family efflux transporter [Candidatus Ruminococcus equi]
MYLGILAKNKKNKDIWKGVISNIYSRLFIVFLANEFAIVVASFVDGVLVGEFLGENALAAQSLVSPFWNIASLFAFIVVGFRIQCSAAFGKGSLKEAKNLFSQTLFVMIILGTIFMFASYTYSDKLTVLMGAKDNLGNIHPEASEYLRGLSFATLPYMINPLLISLLSLTGDEKRTIVAIAICAVLNIILDIVALSLDMGIFGIGLASSVSYFCVTLILLTHFLSKHKMIPLRLSMVSKEMIGVASAGINSIVKKICAVTTSLFLNYLILFFGSVDVMAALSIRSQSGMLAGFIIAASGDLVLLISGAFHGEKNSEGCYSALKYSLKFILILSSIASIIMILLSPFLVYLFLPESKGESVYEVALRAVIILGISVPIHAIENTLSKFYQSGPNKRIPMLSNIFCQFLFFIISLLTLVWLFGDIGLWFAYIATDVFSILFMICYAMRINKRPLRSFKDIMALPKSFIVEKEDIIEEKIDNIDQQKQLFEQVNDFCKQHNFSKEKSDSINICIKEATENYFEHSHKPKKKAFLIVRIIAEKNKNVTITLKDNGRLFDPVDYHNQHSSDKSYENHGIYKIMKYSSDVNYVNIYGINNLFIHINK